MERSTPAAPESVGSILCELLDELLALRDNSRVVLTLPAEIELEPEFGGSGQTLTIDVARLRHAEAARALRFAADEIERKGQAA